MSKNISYGYMDNKLKTHKNINNDTFSKEYILQNPIEIFNTNLGVCWDQVFFEKYMFDNNIHLPYKIFYIEQLNKLSSTHMFLIYEYKNNLYYFENSYEKYRGIYKFNNINEIIDYVLYNMRIDEKDNGYIITEIMHKPKFHSDCLEFMNFCINQKLYKERNYMKRLCKMKKCVFLGGTCNESKWREELIPLLKISYFNPVVEDWDEQAQKNEIYEREHDDYCLYTITPKMYGVYSIAEIIDDSNKRPEKTILCLLKEYDKKSFSERQWKSLEQVAKMAKNNGSQVFYNLKDVANYLNK